MSDSINVAEAKAKLSHLLDRAARGEEIVIARAGKPLARLMPLADPPKRKFGIAKHWKLPPDDVLLAPMSEEDLRWAEGAYQTKDELYTRATFRKLAKGSKPRTSRKT
jgi:prevent-host-death family protein